VEYGSFARTGTGGHENVAGSAGQQPIEGLLLMAVGRKRQGNLGKPVAAGTLLERQEHRDIGPLEQPLVVGQEAIDQTPEAWRGGVEGGADGVASDLLQLAGDNGGEKGMRRICTLMLAGIAGLTTDLSDA
jgi:hypothetical protein